MKAFLTREEWAAVKSAAKQRGVRDYLIMLLSLNHGLRVSELVTLRKQDVQFGKLDVQRLKGSLRTVQSLDIESTQLLAEYLPAVFGERLFPINRRTVLRIVKATFKAAGVHPSKACHHTLKRSCGKLMLDAGVNLEIIRQRLGHTSITTTQRAYAQASDVDADKAFAAVMGD